jgi:arabinose-5-phosphate isomerase
MATVTLELDLIHSGIEVLEIEARTLSNLAKNLGLNFAQACAMIMQCKGRIIIMGIGKSGHIAHDLVIALSNSGETSEILSLIPALKQQNIKIISLCGVKNSKLANCSDLVLNIEIEFEACPLNLAPTASTTAALALGDALAVAVLKAKGFTARDFARSHPGGKLGRTLLLKVKDIMQIGQQIPIVYSGVKIAHAVIEISNKRLGMAAILEPNKQQVIGICTDGDLRRAISQHVNLYEVAIDEIMTPNFVSIDSQELAVDALKLMKSHHINGLLVIEQQQLIGAFNMHDLLIAGIM